MLYNYCRANTQIHVFSDASGSRSAGAHSGKEWCQFQWPADLSECHITMKEMVPVVVAAALETPAYYT